MDICFTNQQQRFNVRVGVIIEHQGQYLVINDNHADYEYLIGGRITVFEDSLSAIKREVKEELHEELDDYQLCFSYESFFFESTLKLDYHEIGFIYQAHLKKESLFLKHKETNINHNRFIWKLLDEVIEPQFIFNYIKQYGIPKEVVHLVSDEL